MRYCRACRALVKADDAAACPACRAQSLVSLTELPEEEQEQVVVLKWCENIEEAQVLRAALSGLGIDSMLEDERLISTGANAASGHGGATDTHILIYLKDAEAACEFLRSKEAGELAITDEDILPQPEPDQPGSEKG